MAKAIFAVSLVDSQMNHLVEVKNHPMAVWDMVKDSYEEKLDEPNVKDFSVALLQFLMAADYVGTPKEFQMCVENDDGQDHWIVKVQLY